jgi:hypothetical protein
MNTPSDALVAAESDADLTYDLITAAEEAGYTISHDNWRWSSHFNCLGIVHVYYRDEHLYETVWNIGSMRSPPSSFRRGSRHHNAVLRGLLAIEEHAHETGIDLFGKVSIPRQSRGL